MTFRQPSSGPRWVLPFLAALIAALAAILAGNLSPASAAATAETRVRASSIVAEVPVGPPQSVSAGERLGNEPSRVVDAVATGVAANGGSKIPWTSWQNYPKVTQGGREYAQVGDRLYSRHAVDRLQPSGLGAPAGQIGAGRSISPNFVEDVLSSTKGVPVKGPHGEPRLSFASGTVQVITENNIVITVITR